MPLDPLAVTLVPAHRNNLLSLLPIRRCFRLGHGDDHLLERLKGLNKSWYTSTIHLLT